ncbi:MAG TPA: FAD-dependent oxidoreductase [Microbacterium sp.]|nr:FAD-dependent oxidoreductase [Microbacterium sp.]
MSTAIHDAVIVGGGHNGLAAAAYLARAGRSVVVLERLAHAGGAAVSERPWAGVDARLSRYSYLVSLLPHRIIDELGLRISLRRRRFSSYTPDPSDPRRGILVDTADAAATASSFLHATGDGAEAGRFTAFYERLGPIARTIFPTMTEPLPQARALRARLGDDALWSALVEQPLGELLRSSLQTDLARGIALTDGLIGTFSHSDDETLRQNRCFLYHVIGGGTGDWDVPVGGMGAVTGELARAAREAGAELVTGAEVLGVSGEGHLRYRLDGVEHTITAATVLANVAPAVLERLLAAGASAPITHTGGAPGEGEAPGIAPRDQPPFSRDESLAVPAVVRERLRRLAVPEGAQVKVNLLLTRLPRLRDGEVSPEAAFAGTFHINELETQLERAFATAARGEIPSPLPCEIYCHTLSDPSILAPELAASGMHTLTVFGLHAPDRLVERFGNDALRDRLQAAVIESLNSVLAEPIEDVIATDASGRPCIETKTTHDLEEALRMPGGNIFHGPLSWPWAERDAPLTTPAQRWGVATQHERILLCGSGAVRGGAVSGIGGHNAAMAVLEASGA